MFDIFQERSAQNPDGVILAAKKNGQWRTYSSRDVWEKARALAGGLQSLGIQNGDMSPEQQEKIALISTNRPEWVITDLATQLTGAVLTPLYPTISPQEMEFVLREAGVRKIFIEGKDLYRRFKEALDKLPGPLEIISFEPVAGLMHWELLTDKKLQPDESVIQSIGPQSLATIIYTSGTTGAPKGVMLSHHNIVSNVYGSMPVFTFATPGDKTLSFLPLNHIFERTIIYIYAAAGLQTYFAESMETIGDNLKEVRPFVFTTVPRLLEKVYEKIVGKGLELKGIKKALFFWALNLAKKYDNAKDMGVWYNLQLKLANKLIFSKWREALGGRVQAVVSGSAALQERLIRIFTAANIVVMEGYGLTETSPVISVNHFESENRRIGSIGPVIDKVEVKLAEDGEILCKGPNVMMGYYKRPDQTEEVMRDGWFHTGDIGKWIEGRFLKITDRKKEIFKTSGGKYVAPQSIENKMRESIYIEQIMVVGANRKLVSALIVPSYIQLRHYLNEKGIKAPENNEELVALPEVKQLIRQQLDKYNPLFGHVEQVKKFTLLPREWSIDHGELTPSLKIKRKVIEEKYNKEIEGMYE